MQAQAMDFTSLIKVAPTLTKTRINSPSGLGKHSLRKEQREAIDKVGNSERSLLFADVGTGKTIVMLSALQKWFNEGTITRALVVAPKRVCQHVWLQEIQEWGHIRAKHLAPICIAGATAAQRRSFVKNAQFKTLIINYESLPWLMNEFPKGIPNPGGGDMAIIFDEIDKMKNHKSLRWYGRRSRYPQYKELTARRYGDKMPEFRARLDEDWVLRKVGASYYTRFFKYRIGATGTPTPNNYCELWAQAYLMDDGRALGDNYESFIKGHFWWGTYSNSNQPQLKSWHKEELESKIEPMVSSMQYAPDMPKVIELPPRWVDFDAKAYEVYKKFEALAIMELESMEVQAVSTSALWQKLRQLSSGFAYGLKREDLYEAIGGRLREQEGAWLDSVKHEELNTLVSEMQGKQLLVVYDYKEQAKTLADRYGWRMRFLDGRTSDRAAAEAIQLWNSKQIQLLGIHPKSAGHGLNLQKSMCEHIVFLTLPMSAGEYKQVIGRIARRNGAEHVTVHKILTEGTQDHEDLDRVEGKIQTLQEFLSSMKARVEARTV